MDNKINHIKNLVYLGRVDDDFHEKEKEFIKKVGARLGIKPDDLEKELNSQIEVRPPLPANEILRFILLDDLINLMASDGKIREQEINACKEVAVELGFQDDVISTISAKIKRHIQDGFVENVTQVLIKNELFKLTTKNYYNEKYS